MAELEQQSLVSGEPIGLVVGDLDHFKEVNDSCGHATGDAVLKEVAYEMRKELRAFDLAYRLGGEEFLVVLPGADADQAERLAERLREIIAAVHFSGDQRLTMSFGVSASPRGERFDYQHVFGEADMALFEAKRSGRDRVCLRRRGARAASCAVAPSRAGSSAGAVEYRPRGRAAGATEPVHVARGAPRASGCSPRPRRPGTTSATPPDVQDLIERVDDSLRRRRPAAGRRPHLRRAVLGRHAPRPQRSARAAQSGRSAASQPRSRS